MTQNIHINHMYKVFGSQHVFSDFSYQFDPSITFIKGENGCGKTTLLRLLCAIEQPTKGSISIANIDTKHVEKIKKIVGYSPNSIEFYEFVTGAEFLNMIAAIKDDQNFEKAKSFIDMFAMEPNLNKELAHMSLGMKKKLSLIGALIGEPPILLLDEPTNGLDSQSYENLVKYLKGPNPHSISIIATHNKTMIKNLDGEFLYLD